MFRRGLLGHEGAQKDPKDDDSEIEPWVFLSNPDDQKSSVNQALPLFNFQRHSSLPYCSYRIFFFLRTYPVRPILDLREVLLQHLHYYATRGVSKKLTTIKFDMESATNCCNLSIIQGSKIKDSLIRPTFSIDQMFKFDR